MELMNVNDAMARLNNNKKLYIMLLKKFDGKSMLDDLKVKVTSGDVAASESSAHTLKGVAANLSLMDLRAETEAIDNRLKKGDINVDLSNLEAIMENTVAAVKVWIAENS